MDAGVDGAIYPRVEGAPDHPQTLVFPEGEYLKGWDPEVVRPPRGSARVRTSRARR